MPKGSMHLLSSLQVLKIEPQSKTSKYHDGGGLYLRVRKLRNKISKEWVFRFTSPITQTRRYQTLGTFPTTSLKSARVLAHQQRQLLEIKVDPLEYRKKNLLVEIEALRERERKDAKIIEVIFYEWKRVELKNRKDNGHDAELYFKKDVFPVIGNKPIHRVTREDIKTVLDRPVKRGAKRGANVLLSYLKQFFRYADDEEMIEADPTRKFTKARVGGKQQSRTRVLKQDELKVFSSKLQKAEMPEQYKHAILLYLATGCRRNEVISAPLDTINLKTRNFNIPPDKAKNTDEHNIYLSDFALAQAEKIISLSNSEKWLFPNENDTNHITKGVVSRNIRLRQSQPKKNENSRWPKKYTDEFVLPGGYWVLHDLRRTAATAMQELGIAPHIVKKCLNQRINDPIIETYQRAELIEEQKQAFNKLGQYLSEIFD